MRVINYVKKLQSGGLFNPIPLAEMPKTQHDTSTDSTPKKDNEKPGFIDQDFLSKNLLGKGLTNDVNAYSAMLNNAANEYQNMSELQRRSSRGIALKKEIAGDIGKINSMHRSNTEYKNSLEHIDTIDAMNELAQTSRGSVMFNSSTGKLEEVSFDKVKEKTESGNYMSLTNGELASLRENSPSLVGDTISIMSLRSANSMPEVTKNLKAILTGIGSTKTSSTGSHYEKSTQGAIVKGVEALGDMAANGQVFSVDTDSSSDSNSNQIKLALSYAWQTMAKGDRAYLRNMAASEGYTGDDIDKRCVELIGILATSHTKEDFSQSRKLSYDKALSEDSGSKKNDTDGVGWASNLAFGTGQASSREIIVNDDLTKNSASIMLNITNNGMYMNQNGEYEKDIPVSNMQSVLSMTDQNNMSFNGKHVNNNDLKHLVYTGEDVERIKNVPYKIEKDDNGESYKVPDFSANYRKSVADNEIRKLYGLNARPMDIAEVYNRYDISTDANNNLKTMDFIATNVIIGGDNELAQGLDSKINTINDKTAKKVYDDAVTFGGKAKIDSNKTGVKPNTPMFFGDDLKRDKLYMPIDQNKNTHTIGVLSDKNKIEMGNKPNDYNTSLKIQTQNARLKAEGKPKFDFNKTGYEQ